MLVYQTNPARVPVPLTLEEDLRAIRILNLFIEADDCPVPEEIALLQRLLDNYQRLKAPGVTASHKAVNDKIRASIKKRHQIVKHKKQNHGN